MSHPVYPTFPTSPAPVIGDTFTADGATWTFSSIGWVKTRIKSGVATTQDLKLRQMLTKNNITGVPVMGSPLATLFSSLELELEDVERAIR
jgi:hypothetical protein